MARKAFDIEQLEGLRRARDKAEQRMIRAQKRYAGALDRKEELYKQLLRRTSEFLKASVALTQVGQRPLDRPKQKIVLAELLRGRSVKEIAREMGITARGVKYHVTNLLQKYGATNQQELRKLVQEKGSGGGK